MATAPHNLPYEELADVLAPYVSDNKKAKIEAALGYRTRYLALVLEDIAKPQNASATLRTCDCLGVQDIHVIENRTSYEVNPCVALGASQWITLHRHNAPGTDNTAACFEGLRTQGYRIVATSPNAGALALEEVPLDCKVALLFGNEEDGLSDGALAAADACLRLPMYGFTPSYNLSVSVALTLFHLVRRLHDADVPWHLTPAEKTALTYQWYREIAPHADLIEKAHIERRP